MIGGPRPRSNWIMCSGRFRRPLQGRGICYLLPPPQTPHPPPLFLLFSADIFPHGDGTQPLVTRDDEEGVSVWKKGRGTGRDGGDGGVSQNNSPSR